MGSTVAYIIYAFDFFERDRQAGPGILRKNEGVSEKIMENRKNWPASELTPITIKYLIIRIILDKILKNSVNSCKIACKLQIPIDISITLLKIFRLLG